MAAIAIDLEVAIGNQVPLIGVGDGAAGGYLLAAGAQKFGHFKIMLQLALEDHARLAR